MLRTMCFSTFLPSFWDKSAISSSISVFFISYPTDLYLCFLCYFKVSIFGFWPKFNFLAPPTTAISFCNSESILPSVALPKTINGFCSIYYLKSHLNALIWFKYVKPLQLSRNSQTNKTHDPYRSYGKKCYVNKL